MLRISALLLLVKLSLSAAAGFSYDRAAKNGPYYWKDLNIAGNQCDASTDEQSPRDICGAKTASLMLGAQDSWKYTGGLKVHNNGHTIQVNFDVKDAPQTVNMLADQVGRTTSAGKQTWQVQQVHFHWARSDMMGGSEHVLAGKYHSMEAHFVHFNTKYKDVTDAVVSGNKDALLVIGVFLSISPKESGFMNSIGNAIAGATKTPMTYKSNSGDFTKFAEANILPKDAVFNNYAGGLTTPTCNEVVTWVVMEQSCMITKDTMAKFMKATAHPKASRLRRNLGGDADETISKYGNFRPLSLNKNPVYSSSAKSVSQAKCKHTYAQQKMMMMTVMNCPAAYGKFSMDNCADYAITGKCDRDPTAKESMAACNEFKNSAKCMNDAGAKNMFASCPTYAYKAMYPSCKRGYWNSGCGQPAMKQKSMVMCYGMSGGNTWVAKDADCAGMQKPAVTERTCPATKPCPRCKGCKRNGGCYKTCGGKAGKCSSCNCRDGRMGACCQKGNKNDPIECRLAEFQFESDKVHTCALLPKDMHTGYLIKNIMMRLDDVEKEVDALKPKKEAF